MTYGTFRPNEEGVLFPEPAIVSQDFAHMAKSNINSVRVYTVPPVWLLDLAQKHNLRVMVGLPWEQHLTFLDSRKQTDEMIGRLKGQIRMIAGHPAILCYAIGNEIPSGIVRWYGRSRIERFLKRLYWMVKGMDAEALVSYVNYPPTEYLQLPFLDFYCFNVYLESEDKLSAYLSRLHNLSAERPLVMAEIGLDSRRNGTDTQAGVLDWQIRRTFQSGAAGVFIFSWTDEWYRGGFDIDDWDFGLTTRDRTPKPALQLVGDAFEHAWREDEYLPKISVAICTLNGAATLRECLEAVFQLDYPEFEVIVVSDGSTDDTEHIASEYDCLLIATPNYGLSSARNTAWQAAAGEIVAYIDDDAYPDKDWLRFLAQSFQESNYAAIGGPNIPPPDDGDIAFCVANAPGGPSHVLLSDHEAEHIPGCNMAFRREVLEKVGGFDPGFRIAGDDVDICWRIQDQQMKIGFNPSAVVWHHRRNSVRAYWRQQKGYGKAEALLEQKWPARFNAHGHLNWGGRLYSSGKRHAMVFPRWQIYHGVWGTGFFQSLYERSPNRLSIIPVLPEWYMILGFLMGLGLLGFLWSPMLWAFPLAGAGILLTVMQAVWNVFYCNSAFSSQGSGLKPLKLKLITLWLYLTQPLVRLRGRLSLGLTWWRRRNKMAFAFPHMKKLSLWSEEWKSTEQWLSMLESECLNYGMIVRRGKSSDRWDLELQEGLSTPARLIMVIEEHGAGKQMLKFRIWPAYQLSNWLFPAILLILGVIAALAEAWIVAAILSVIAIGMSRYVLNYSYPILKNSLKKLGHLQV